MQWLCLDTGDPELLLLDASAKAQIYSALPSHDHHRAFCKDYSLINPL